MREILYKAKRMDNGEWVEGFFCYQKLYCYDNRITPRPIIIGELSNTGIVKFEIDESTVCQYTGLTDKNGQKIWENDIVRHEDLSNGRYIARKQPMKNSLIKWNHIDAKFERDGGRDLYKSESRLEVIGNIFDNAELLERKE